MVTWTTISLRNASEYTGNKDVDIRYDEHGMTWTIRNTKLTLRSPSQDTIQSQLLMYPYENADHQLFQQDAG